MLWQIIGGKGITWNHHASALSIKLVLQGIARHGPAADEGVESS